MISRRLGGGDEAYCTYVEEADDDANKDSAFVKVRTPHNFQVAYGFLPEVLFLEPPFRIEDFNPKSMKSGKTFYTFLGKQFWNFMKNFFTFGFQ